MDDGEGGSVKLFVVGSEGGGGAELLVTAGGGGGVELFVVGGEGGSGAKLLVTAGDGDGVELLGNSVLDSSLVFLLLISLL